MRVRRRRQRLPVARIVAAAVIALLVIGFVQYIRNGESSQPPVAEESQGYPPVMFTLTNGRAAQVMMVNSVDSYTVDIGYANSIVEIVSGPCYLEEVGGNALDVICNDTQRIGTIIMSPASVTFSSSTSYNILKTR